MCILNLRQILVPTNVPFCKTSKLQIGKYESLVDLSFHPIQCKFQPFILIEHFSIFPCKVSVWNFQRENSIWVWQALKLNQTSVKSHFFIRKWGCQWYLSSLKREDDPSVLESYVSPLSDGKTRKKLWSVIFSWTLPDRLSTWPETAPYSELVSLGGEGQSENCL